ncbi:NACHT domain-containing protein [Actinoplanes sp. NPDC051494]|uniref:NACHT domain-containing protein n=1 Tax=Actinoplanes sp. NPDC051494 TaxID=3363907 RepID=UPI0037B78969
MSTIQTIVSTALLTLGLIGSLAYLRRRWRDVSGEVLRRVVEPLIWFFLRFFKRSMAERTSLRAYCRVQIKNPETRVLHVPGRWGTNLNIKTVYVPLSLESSTNRSVHHPDDIWSGDASRVRIVGEPGSGKSTFVKHLFLHACEQAREAKHGLLPIILELRQLTPPRRMTNPDKLTTWLLGELRAKVEMVHGYQMRELFEAAVRGQGVLVLLDGLDEVPSDRYRAVSAAIVGLSRKLTNDSVNSRLLLTMRTQFHDQIRADFDPYFESTYRIKKFSSADAYTFLTKWPFPGDSLASANRIYGDLTDRPTLREMCSNPLILAMYVANDQGGSAGAPDTRTAFYNHVVEELLVARRSRQLGVSAKSALQEQREQILGPLAYENLTDPTQPANSIPWSRAMELATRMHGCTSDEDAEQVLLNLCKETGIIAVEKPGESLRFLHLTFCEFLAARECIRIRPDGWRLLMDLHVGFAALATTRTRLIELIPFALGLLPPVQQMDAMDDVWKSRDRALAGYCFLETRRYDHSAWESYAVEESTSLIETESSDWDESFLRRLHLFNIILADENEWRRMYGQPCPIQLEEVFRKLVRGDQSRLVAIFSSYAAFDAPAAFRLARTCSVDLLEEHPDLLIENAALPPFLALIIQGMNADPERSDVWSAVLCEAALRQSAVARLLVEIGTEDLELTARVNALKRREQWFFRPGRRMAPQTSDYRTLMPNALTYVTTMATAHGPRGGEKTIYGYLEEFRRIKPLGARRIPSKPQAATVLPFTGLVLTIFAASILNFLDNFRTTREIVFAVSLIIAVSLCLILIAISLLMQMYYTAAVEEIAHAICSSGTTGTRRTLRTGILHMTCRDVIDYQRRRAQMAAEGRPEG